MLSKYITAKEDQEIAYLQDRFTRLQSDMAYGDLCRFVDSLYRKYGIRR